MQQYLKWRHDALEANHCTCALCAICFHNCQGNINQHVWIYEFQIVEVQERPPKWYKHDGWQKTVSQAPMLGAVRTIINDSEQTTRSSKSSLPVSRFMILSLPAFDTNGTGRVSLTRHPTLRYLCLDLLFDYTLLYSLVSWFAREYCSMPAQQIHKI